MSLLSVPRSAGKSRTLKSLSSWLLATFCSQSSGLNRLKVKVKVSEYHVEKTII